MNAIRISPQDNVAVALQPITKNTQIEIDGISICAIEDIAQGHKFALQKIEEGKPILKYGYPIGMAKLEIAQGAWVHVHNVKTMLSEQAEYKYNPEINPLTQLTTGSFDGYLRADGSVGIRNELWIIPTVGCVNSIAQKLVQDNQHLVSGSLEGLYTFPHPFGCSQMGDDHAQTRSILASLVRHPNAGGVLVLGLGCENLTMEQFKAELGEWDENRVKFMVCQDIEDEFKQGAEILLQLATYCKSFERQPLPASKLVVGMKCGGSDGLSGITANPAVGRFSDYLIAMGGTTVLTEVPEMFGAENMLFSRCVDETVFKKAVKMVDDFKEYFVSHGQVVYENPSPGNKEGGITTLEDKSCGCVQKGGTAPIVDVVPYGGQITKNGLNLLSGPGNDLVSTTALTAAGAHIILFTTGRGTPFGAPAPTVKISTNHQLAQKKSGWIDFDTGAVADGESLEIMGERLLNYVLDVASGKKTKTEENNFREISIFKDGVIL